MPQFTRVPSGVQFPSPIYVFPHLRADAAAALQAPQFCFDPAFPFTPPDRFSPAQCVFVPLPSASLFGDICFEVELAPHCHSKFSKQPQSFWVSYGF